MNVHVCLLLVPAVLQSALAGQTARRAESDPMTSWLSSASRSKPNVLFLLVDDFRPFLRSYGESFMVTPNIDQLASKSVRFDRAYAQQAVCVPSRLSFTTGRRPLTLKVLDLKTYWRDPVRGGGNFTTLSQYFQQNGYVSHGAGKIYHNGKSSGGTFDYPYSWSDKVFFPDPTVDLGPKRSASYIYVNETATEKLKDTLVTDHAIRWLENRDTQKPFFLAVGFSKPHLPFAFPQKFLALYDETNIQLAKYRTPPAGLPRFVLNSWGELRGYADIKALGLASNELVLPDDVQFKLKQAYAAAVTHVDDQVGRLLSRLSELGLTNNTIITFISDHGYQLGENAQWVKHSNFETAVKVPLLVHVPGVTDDGNDFTYIDPFSAAATQPYNTSATPSTDHVVELVDLFSTVAELAGLPVPPACEASSSHVALCSEGLSLVPLVRGAVSPTGAARVPWKDAAFSVYPRRMHSKTSPILGITMRTARYRYTEWVHFNFTTWEPDYQRVKQRELYMHPEDRYEHFNKADDPQHSVRKLVEELSEKLRAGWLGARNRYLHAIGSD